MGAKSDANLKQVTEVRVSETPTFLLSIFTPKSCHALISVRREQAKVCHAWSGRSKLQKVCVRGRIT